MRIKLLRRLFSDFLNPWSPPIYLGVIIKRDEKKRHLVKQDTKKEKPGYPLWNARLVESLATTSPLKKKVAHLTVGKTRTVKKYLYPFLAYGKNIMVNTKTTIQKFCQVFFLESSQKRSLALLITQIKKMMDF
jgi:hypothetical protein